MNKTARVKICTIATRLDNTHPVFKQMPSWSVQGTLIWQHFEHLQIHQVWSRSAIQTEIDWLYTRCQDNQESPETADPYARQWSSTPYICPEPALRCQNNWYGNWGVNLPMNKYRRSFMKNRKTASIKKEFLSIITGLLFEQYPFRGHLNKIELYSRDLSCRQCNKETENLITSYGLQEVAM